MAEINIKRKERALWPWILGGLVLVLIILLLAGVFSKEDDPYYDRQGTDTTTEVAPAADVWRLS